MLLRLNQQNSAPFDIFSRFGIILAANISNFVSANIVRMYFAVSSSVSFDTRSVREPLLGNVLNQCADFNC
jgi:hypothetical protein